ncbi:MAG: hypothetical protein M3P91_11070 [Actinomycetota bacterium]|nr:hypothetical protein [Actinomycetota bacterium]
MSLMDHLGAVHAAETAVLAVLGQQVSVRAPRAFADRLVLAYGEPAGDGLTAFPWRGYAAAAPRTREVYA